MITVIELVHSRITIKDRSSDGEMSHRKNAMRHSMRTHRRLVMRIQENATARAFMNACEGSIVDSEA